MQLFHATTQDVYSSLTAKVLGRRFKCQKEYRVHLSTDLYQLGRADRETDTMLPTVDIVMYNCIQIIVLKLPFILVVS